MRRTAALLALLLFTLPLEAYQVKRRPIEGTPPPSCTATGISFWWRAEGTTLDANDDYYMGTGDSTATASGSVTLDAAAVKNGTNGVLVNASSEHYQFDPDEDVPANALISGTKGRMGAWVRYPLAGDTEANQYPANGTNGAGILGNRKGSSGPWVLLRFRGSSSARGFRLEWYDGTNTYFVQTADNSISGDNWYFVEAMWDSSKSPGADILRIYVGGVEAASSTTETLTPFTNDGTTGLRIGDWQGLATVTKDFYVDHVIVSSDETKSLYLCADTLVYP